MVQWYGYVPAAENDADLTPALAMLPQSGPLSNVTVWAVVSPFVHVTVPPALMVVAPGVNAKFATATCAPAAGPTVHNTAAAGCDACAGGAWVAELPPHAV